MPPLTKHGRGNQRTRTSQKAQGMARMTRARELQLLERRYQVWKLRKDGLTVHDIAETLDINVETVRDDFRTIASRLANELAETVEENISLQIERMDNLLKRYMPLATAGNLAAASMVLAVEARRSKLLGLDRPEQKKLEVSGVREYVGVDIDDV